EEHVGTRVRVLLGAVGLGRLPLEELLEGRDAALIHVLVDLHVGGAGQGEAVDDVGRHVGVRLVVLPPAPAAVTVLEAGEAGEPAQDATRGAPCAITGKAGHLIASDASSVCAVTSRVTMPGFSAFDSNQSRRTSPMLGIATQQESSPISMSSPPVSVAFPSL